MTAVNGNVISEVLLQMYDMPHEADFFEHVLHLMKGHIPFLMSGYSMVDLRAKALDMKVLRNREGTSVANLSEIEKLVRSHPRLEVCCKNSMGPVVGTIDLLPEKEWKKTTLYNEVHRKLGLVHDTSMRFYVGSKCVSFTFCDKMPLEQDSYHFLNLIAPHLSPAYDIYNLQRQGLLEQTPEHAVVVSKQGRYSKLSPTVVEFFQKYYPTEKQQITHCLPDAVERWFQQERLKGASAEKLIVRGPGRALSLRLLRTPTGFLILCAESIEKDFQAILREMGLTKREAEVMLWVSQGKQNSAVAMILGISPSTIRKHVEHILEKLMCETRGAASNLVLQKMEAK